VINEEPPKYNDISKYTLCKIKKNNVEYELKFSLNPSNDELYTCFLERKNNMFGFSISSITNRIDIISIISDINMEYIEDNNIKKNMLVYSINDIYVIGLKHEIIVNLIKRVGQNIKLVLLKPKSICVVEEF
jgi:hypothetical protein